MKNSFRLILAALFGAGLLGITGCDTHQERYEEPPWLGGSSIETLEERGNYTIFLRLMEMANYTDPITKQLFTLFVPDDNAFNTYFASAGINSVEDLSDDEAVQLFTLHVLRNPRSRFYLIYEYAWNELQTPKAEYASLFHRKITPSKSIPYMETVRYLPGFVGEERLIGPGGGNSGNKNIPLFTQEFFYDYGGAEDGSDYTFMYPGSTWEEGYPEDIQGMNWHNAMVIPNPEIPDELEVRTASGFIYFLDRVVPPLPSIEEFLIANQDKYGLYYDLLQRFGNYRNTYVDEELRVLYQKTYDLIFDLAEERGPSVNTAVPPQNMWSALLPPDNVLQTYLDNTVLKYYASIDSVPKVTLYYILQTQLSGSLVLKSKLKDGYFNSFGDPTDLTEEDIVSGYMCSNGVVYETSRVLEPSVFTTVPGVLFFDKNYSTLLYTLNQSNMLSTVSNPEANVTLFASTNAALEEYGIRYDPLSDVVQFRGPVDGKWGPMKSTELVYFAQDQIHMGLISDLEGEGGYAEMSSSNYIRYGNNQAAAGENQAYSRPAVIEEIEVNDYNGLLVKVEQPIQSRVVMGQLLACAPNDDGCFLADPDVSEFGELLIDLKFLDNRFRDPITKEVIPNLKFLSGSDYWTGFIPTNTAMAQARAEGIIPEEFPSSGEGKDSLKVFVNYHFIKGNVVFDDGKESGIFDSNHIYFDSIQDAVVNEPLLIANELNNLTIEDVTGQIITLDHENANRLVRRGVMHKIDEVLKYTE